MDIKITGILTFEGNNVGYITQDLTKYEENDPEATLQPYAVTTEEFIVSYIDDNLLNCKILRKETTVSFREIQNNYHQMYVAERFGEIEGYIEQFYSVILEEEIPTIDIKTVDFSEYHTVRSLAAKVREFGIQIDKNFYTLSNITSLVFVGIDSDSSAVVINTDETSIMTSRLLKMTPTNKNEFTIETANSIYYLRNVDPEVAEQVVNNLDSINN